MAIAYCREDHQNLQQQIHYARTKWRLMYLVGDIGCGLTSFGWIWWCELDHRILVRFGKAKICRAGWDMRNGRVSQWLQFSKIVSHIFGKTVLNWYYFNDTNQSVLVCGLEWFSRRWKILFLHLAPNSMF